MLLVLRLIQTIQVFFMRVLENHMLEAMLLEMDYGNQQMAEIIG